MPDSDKAIESDPRVQVEKFPNTEVTDSRRFTWEIRDWHKLSERACSVPIECGGYLFEILLFPNGNPASSRQGFVSLYLNALGPAPSTASSEVKKLKRNNAEMETVTEEDMITNHEAPGEDLATHAMITSISEADSHSRLSTQTSNESLLQESLLTSTDGTGEQFSTTESVPSDLEKSATDVKPEQKLRTFSGSEANSDPSEITESDKPWYVCSSFALTMYNPESPKSLQTQRAHHRFSPKVTDWGYTEYISIRSAFVATQIGSAPLIAPLSPAGDLGVNVTVDIDVLADPTGILWHDFENYDSREVTGYTGLVNQGATCYLNSLLQSLYFTGAFRNAVYAIPNPSGATGGLQRLFYKLATSKPAVDTTDLTNAFGWDSTASFMQHDVQELARVLMDRVEAKMKGTEVEGFLTKLFVGRMRSFIKCINVPFESSREEEFWDIQLNVKNMGNVYDSFRDYCASETLEGDNQYAAGEHGLQDAVKGVIFQSLPPVLHLQLKRYDFDWMRETEVKVNDLYEFPLELDLAEFVEDDSRPWKYQLHGVLVHSGELNAGHYYALIKPEANGDWYRFDDDRVTKASLHEVLEENFGGNEGSAVRRVTSAYMLVYIRSDSLDFVLPKGKSSPPTEVMRKIEAELKAEELRLQAIAEQQQYLTIRVLSPESYEHHVGLGVVPWLDNTNELEQPKLLKVRLDTSLDILNTQMAGGSMWLAPPKAVPQSVRVPQRKLQMLPLRHGYEAKDLALWVGHASPLVFSAPAPPVTPGGVSEHRYRMVFTKSFYAGNLKAEAVAWIDAHEPLQTTLNLDESSSVYVESGRSSPAILRLDMMATAESAGVQMGDILIVTSNDDHLEQYLDNMANKLRLVLNPIYSRERENDQTDSSGTDDEESGKKGSVGDITTQVINNDESIVSNPKELSVTIDIRDSPESVVEKIGAAVGHDGSRLQLRSYPASWKPSVTLHSSGDNISELWCDLQSDVVPILYRKLSMPLATFESLVELPIVWLEMGFMGEESEKILLSEPQTPVVESVAQKLGVPDKEVGIYVSKHSRKVEEINRTTIGQVAGFMSQGLHIYAARLTPGEISARELENAKLVTVYHYNKDPTRSHGDPFKCAIVPNEVFADTRKRVFELMRHVSRETDKTLEKIKFSLVCDGIDDPRYIETDDTVLYDKFQTGDSLGLDHPERRRNLIHQQAIHID